MLDTNMVGALIGATAPQVELRLAAFRADELCISVVTEAEILFGLAKNPQATRLAGLMRASLARFPILAWTSSTAAVYAQLRAVLQSRGKSLQPLDMLIAAHAVSIGATLVTSDTAFHRVPGLTIENWRE